MSRMNTIADAMSTIKNAVDTGRRACVVQPASKLVGSILGIMKEHGYISGFEYVEDGRGGHFVVGLKGSINRCGAITPRFSVTLDELEEWETRYLPGKNFGILVITTSKGVMSHRRAREIGVGGELLAFVY